MGAAKNTYFAGKQFFLTIATVLVMAGMLNGCALVQGEQAESLEVSEAGPEDASESADAIEEAKTPELAQAEDRVKELEQQLETLKVEWAQQKPALERLVNNEADLEFLVQALADMSQLADEPSREQYLGQDEMTPEKRQESLVALQSLVTSQEELNTLLVELSSVVADVAANSQNVGVQTPANQPTNTDTSLVVADNAAETLSSDTQNGDNQQSSDMSASVSDISTNQSASQTVSMPNSSMPQTVSTSQTAATPVSADCNCSNSEPTSTTAEDPAKARDPSWYAMTTPYAEATPAGSNSTVSQLDSGAASGQPIPGLQVKTFKRRTLPSELAAAGADMQQYAMAPQFHMSRKSLSDYVSQLAFKLAGNQQLSGNRIGVASFVFFDEQLEQTSSVGNQLAKELSTVSPNYGARVIEYKLTREITVSPTGDLSLSRNTQKLRDSQGMDYVLTGTMVPTRRGLQINSRVVSTRDNVVIASATTLIPAMVLQQL